MSEASISTSALLDLAAASDDEVVRQRVIDRLSTSAGAVPRRAANGLRGASATVESFLDRLRIGGIPASPRALDRGAVDLGRKLLDLDSESLDRVARDLGTVEAVVLLRSMDRDSATEALRSLSSVRDRLARCSGLAPELSRDGVDRAIRQFMALSPRGFTGTALVRALGRSLLASLLKDAEPDVVAAIGLRIPLTADDDDASVDVAWFSVAALLADRRAADAE